MSLPDLAVSTDTAVGPSETVLVAIKRLKLAKQAREKQLQREIAALKFQVPALQWDDDMRMQRQAVTIDGVMVPPRPMLSIPKLNQPIQLVLNQQQSAHLGVNVSPLSEDAKDDTAEVIRDLYRREEQRSRAGLARAWAFDRAVKAGYGAYAIDTEYDEESSNPFDQRIVWRRILYQDGVYLDPTAQEPDWSDMEYGFELQWMRLSKIRRDFPDADIANTDDDELKTLAQSEPDWVAFSEAQDEPMVLVAVYWRKDYKERTWTVLDDGSFAFVDEIPAGRKLHPDPKVRRTRSVQVPTVYRSIITAREELNKPEEWNGCYIPLIPVIGVEVQPFDGERRWMGVIEPSMDAQRLFNYAASSAVELSALEPKAPYMMADGQDEGYETMWQQANIRNFPSLKYQPKIGPNNELLPPPQRTQADTSKLGPSMMLLERADQFISASTTTLDQGRIEQMGQRRVAHQTISALQEQSDLGNSHYLNNLATISMPYEAKVVIDLMAKIYDRPGRVARLLSLEDDERTVMLNRPFVMHPETKRPMPAQPQIPGQPPQDNVKHYDLTKGKYGVSVTIGKSWQNRIQQGADELGELLKDPEMFALIGPIYMKFRDFPGAKEASDLLKRYRAMKFPGLEQDPNNPNAGPSREELMGQVQQMQSQLQEAGKAIETDQIKTQSQERIAQGKNLTALAAKEMDNETKLAVAELGANVDRLSLFLEERGRVGVQQHESALAAADAGHEELMAQQAHQQAQDLAAQGVAGQAALADQGHGNTLAQQQQAAALAPKPEAE